MNTPTYTFNLLKSIPFLWEWLRVFLFCVGMLPSICFAHLSTDSDSVSVDVENQITTKGETKIFIVEGVVTSNLHMGGSVEIVSVPAKKEKNQNNLRKRKAKNAVSKIVKKEKEKTPNSKLSFSASAPDKSSLFNHKQEAKICTSSNSHSKQKKKFIATYLQVYQNFDSAFFASFFIQNLELNFSYLSIYKIDARPPPFFIV